MTKKLEMRAKWRPCQATCKTRFPAEAQPKPNRFLERHFQRRDQANDQGDDDKGEGASRGGAGLGTGTPSSTPCRKHPWCGIVFILPIEPRKHDRLAPG